MAKKEAKTKKANRKRRAVSPVIATIILIMIVIIIAIIIILIARNFFKEIVLKEVGDTSKRVEDFCPEVKLKPILNDADGSFGVSNEGNVPIYGIVVKTSKGGDSTTIKFPDIPINPGYSKMINITNPSGGNYKRTDFESLKIMPTLLGKTKADFVEPYTCPDNYGVEI